MSVVPPIIVLVITALLVFRHELTHLAAPTSKPTPAPRRRPLRQSQGEPGIWPRGVEIRTKHKPDAATHLKS
jgi:hypothetical protein